MRYTNHALYRLNERLNGLVSAWDISKKLFAKNRRIPLGRSYLIVKKFEQVKEVCDPSVQPDGIARGDMIVAVIDNTDDIKITTILLRKSTSKADEYQYLNAAEFGL